jgi:hypothetical protein
MDEGDHESSPSRSAVERRRLAAVRARADAYPSRPVDLVVIAVLRDADARQRLEAQVAEVVAGSPEEFRAFIAAEITRLSRVIRAANIRLD